MTCLANGGEKDMKSHCKGFYKYCKGEKLKDIAKDLNVTEAAVKNWMTRYNWVNKRNSCRNDDGSVNLEKARGFLKGKGNVEPVPKWEVTEDQGAKNINTALLNESPHDEDFKLFVQQTLTNSVRNLGVSRVASDYECKVRIVEYFKDCIDLGYIPTIEGLWLCLGIGRTCFYDWCNGKQGTVRAEILQNAKLCIHEFNTQLAIAGRMDKILYMFISKNWYGMKDQNDTVVHHDNTNALQSKDEIQQRIMQGLPDDG